ncbi:MAG TPA: pirin family protein [Streptosporangiaceae bacterium]|nr:pirin family protein [Streptosporangiaceae bacterium]
MSTVDAELETPGSPVRESDPPAGHTELTSARLARVGDIEVRRLLPLRRRRSVGAWCFVDHHGPMSVDGVSGIQVPPHPHIGLQTVTWLLDGNVLHRDSLGSEQMIRPGQLNLMTAGRGIAHSEESPADHDPGLHGVQLWLALPDADRRAAPAFEHHAQLPVLGLPGFEVTVFAGSLADVTSPARTYSPLVGAEIHAVRDGSGIIPLVPGHEHVIFVARGQTVAGGIPVSPGSLLYLGTGRDALTLTGQEGARLLLLGGEPLGETLLMWWNFVGRTPDDIIEAARAWSSGGRFGDVHGYRGAPLPAPPLDAVRLARRASGS